MTPPHETEFERAVRIWEETGSLPEGDGPEALLLRRTLLAVDLYSSSPSDAEIEAVKEFVASQGSEAILCQHWAKGSEGTEALAKKVVELADSGMAQFSPLYEDDMPLFEKINTIVKRIYRGSEAIADKSVRTQLQQWEEAGYGHLPVCMAKTQYSFSTDPNLRGAPVDHVVPVREVRLSAGAGFVVAICGEIMTMPGLPRTPASEKIFLNEEGLIEGLF